MPGQPIQREQVGDFYIRNNGGDAIIDANPNGDYAGSPDTIGLVIQKTNASSANQALLIETIASGAAFEIQNMGPGNDIVAGGGDFSVSNTGALIASDITVEVPASPAIKYSDTSSIVTTTLNSFTNTFDIFSNVPGFTTRIYSQLGSMNLFVSGNTEVTGTFSANGSILTNSNLDVSGSTNIFGDLFVGGTITGPSSLTLDPFEIAPTGSTLEFTASAAVVAPQYTFQGSALVNTNIVGNIILKNLAGTQRFTVERADTTLGTVGPTFGAIGTTAPYTLQFYNGTNSSIIPRLAELAVTTTPNAGAELIGYDNTKSSGSIILSTTVQDAIDELEVALDSISLIYDAIIPDDYTTPFAALNAGAKTIFIKEGTYNDRGNTLFAATDGIQIIGQNKESTLWLIDNVSLQGDSQKIQNITLGDGTLGDSNIDLAFTATNCILDNITIKSGSITPLAALGSGHRLFNIKLEADIDVVLGTFTNCVNVLVDGLNLDSLSTAITNTTSTSLNGHYGILISTGNTNLTFKNTQAHLTAGSGSTFEEIFRLQGGIDGLTIDGLDIIDAAIGLRAVALVTESIKNLTFKNVRMVIDKTCISSAFRFAEDNLSFSANIEGLIIENLYFENTSSIGPGPANAIRITGGNFDLAHKAWNFNKLRYFTRFISTGSNLINISVGDTAASGTVGFDTLHISDAQLTSPGPGLSLRIGSGSVSVSNWGHHHNVADATTYTIINLRQTSNASGTARCFFNLDNFNLESDTVTGAIQILGVAGATTGSNTFIRTNGFIVKSGLSTPVFAVSATGGTNGNIAWIATDNIIYATNTAGSLFQVSDGGTGTILARKASTLYRTGGGTLDDGIWTDMTTSVALGF